MADGKKRLTIDIDEQLHRRLKARAALEGRSVREYCVRAIERELEREGGTPRGSITRQALTNLDALRQEVFGDRKLSGNSVELLREARDERSRQMDQW